MEPTFYGRPQRAGVRLGVSAAVASWDKAGSPGHARSSVFIDAAHAAVAAQIAEIQGPLALRLEVGLPESVPLFGQHDLDNYLFPLVPRLAERSGRQFASVSATKRHAVFSTICVGPASAIVDPGGECAFDVTTTASASTAAYKQQIHDQVASPAPLPGQSVALELAFLVGPRRSWPNLWKATIDALGPILGHDQGAREWNARDGRITDIGLHCTVDPSVGNSVRIAIRVSPSDEGTEHDGCRA